jgi:long-chain acyl-CoA synthetase
VYGLSESSGPLTCNAAKPGLARLGTVGRPLPGTTVKLAEDGEVLFQGPNVCAGYFKNPEATAATIRDGWLYTGDVGEMDADGFLRITDRKKDLFKTSGGKYVAPQLLEGQLRSIPLIAQALVVGENRQYLTALLTLEPERVLAFAKESGLPEDLDLLAQEPKVLALIQEHVDRLNKTLARFETIKRITVLPRDFTVDNDEMTPSQKLKRKVIFARYASQIEAMYPKTDSAADA